MRLAGKVALVTGSSAGIGSAVAVSLAEEGAHVLVHGRDTDRVEAVARITAGTPILADLSLQSDRRRLVEVALAEFGRIDILVNNAGVGWSGALTQMPVEELRYVLEVDLVAQIELTRLVLPAMVARGEGSVCFVSSVAGSVGVAGEAVYGAAKAGIDAFAASLRAEAVGTGVGIGVVVPAAVRTGFFDSRGRRYDRRLPRPVAPDVVAEVVVRAVTDGVAETWVPRWLRAAPAVRAVAPGVYRRLSQRFGEQIRLSADEPVSDEKGGAR